MTTSNPGSMASVAATPSVTPVTPVSVRVQDFLAELIKVESVEEAFNNFLVHRPDLEQAHRAATLQAWISLLQEIGQPAGGGEEAVGLEEALRTFVNCLAGQKNAKTMAWLQALLVGAVGAHAVSARQVCDAVLTSDHLRYEEEAFWGVSFGLVRRIVGGVDYKGVREIMKKCIEKVVSLPVDLDPSASPQLVALQDLLAYIFDRNAALLPGYFIVNEILKSYPEQKNWPHWALVALIAQFLNSFRPTAQMVTSINRHRMRPIVENTGKAHLVSTWKLDPGSVKFILKGTMTYDRILPYTRSIVEPQRELLRYILRQPYSKEMVNNVFGLQKPRKEAGQPPSQHLPALEAELVYLFVDTMKLAEVTDFEDNQVLWRTLSSELIFFILFQYVAFPSFVQSLASQLERWQLKEGRDDLMWALLQFISGSIAKNTTQEFVPVLRLLALYDEPEPLPIPDTTLPCCIRRLAATAVYIHLGHKAKLDSSPLQFHLPVALHQHYEYLQQLSMRELNMTESLQNDYLIPVLCNTFSTAQDVFQQPMTALVKAIGGNLDPTETVAMPGRNCLATGASEPLSMEILDALSVHSKMSLIHSIVTFIGKHMASKSSLALAPALIETYCRLLVYSEIESLGVKGFINQLFPQAFKQSAWGILHMLLEIFSFRFHHIQANFRLQLLNHLQIGFINAVHPSLNKNSQLHAIGEAATLRLITGLGNSEICPPKAQPMGGTGAGAAKQTTVLYGDSEELNRVVILTLARSIHVNGLEQQSAQWVKEVLTSIMQKTPHSWPSHTLQNFPTILQDFFKENAGSKENKPQLKQKVEEEYKTWTSMSNEHDIIQHFATANNSLFLCVLWKMLLETDHISPVAYKVLDRINAKQLTSHLRSFCDLLVCEFSKSGGSGHVNKCIEAMNNLIWKFNIITLDRLILCMALRTNEGNEAQVCFFIIQLLLLKPIEFRSRVSELVRTMSPEHHIIKDFHKVHLEFHTKYPEKFQPDEQGGLDGQGPAATLPTYFGNVCLRFIPVFDIVVHRFLELPPVTKNLETLIDHVGVLYKFHDRPITYLYNTLHYYERKVRERPSLKRKLISSITGALKEVRPMGWCLTNDYIEYLTIESKDWIPSKEYYLRLVGRLTHSIQGKHPFPTMDWRFNEFPNEGAHALYCTCVEIMGIPGDPSQVGASLWDVVLESSHLIPVDQLPDWINSIGLIMSNLPEAFWEGMYQRLVEAISSAPLSQWTLPQNPFQMFDFESAMDSIGPSRLNLLLALSHSVFHHAGFNQIQTLPTLVKEKFFGLIKTEEQMLFVFHVVGPFLQRLHSEQRYMRPLLDLTVQFYRILHKVDKECAHLKYIDAVCDILYHIKYQFTGDSVKSEVERLVWELSSPLQLRLRFIAPGILQNS